jgi:hypothetical protein
MGRRPVLAAAILCTILVSWSFLTSSPAAAADFSRVGVKTGDWVEYSFNTTNGSIFGNWNRFAVVFQNVTGVMAALNFTFFNPDGSENSSYIRSGNVSNSMATVQVQNMSVLEPILFFFLIPAGLSANDPVFDGAPFRINETTTTVAGGTPRTTNHFSASVGDVSTIYLNMSIFWDKPTGLMVRTDLYINGIGWERLTLTSTSLWNNLFFGLAPSTVLLIIGALAALTIVVEWIAFRRGRKGRKPTTPARTTSVQD